MSRAYIQSVMADEVILLSDIPVEKNRPIAQLFRISKMEYKITKRDGTPCKRPYIQFNVGDRSGEVQAKKWDSSEEEFNRVKDQKVLFVTGKTDIFNDSLQVIVETLAKPDDTVDTDFLLETLTPKTAYDIKNLKKGIWALIQKMNNKWIKQLCEEFVKDPKINVRFSVVPAATKMHHNFKHGLLEHTYRLMVLADDFVDSYNKHGWPGNKIILDKDAVLAGCLLHDMMKCFEYEPEGGYAVEGNLLGHIARGIMEVGSKTAKIENFPEEIKELMAHIISAHHLQIEWGSPDTPCCPEAIVVHYLDDLCSKLDPTILELNRLEKGSKWTVNKIPSLNKLAYIGNSSFLNENTEGMTSSNEES